MKYEPVKDFAERKRILALIERCEKEQIISEDLIKRFDAIESEINNMLPANKPDPHAITYINALENRIKELEKDRPVGKWIRERWTDKYLVGVECSNCHIVESRFSPFCPNCGADMRGESDAMDAM